MSAKKWIGLVVVFGILACNSDDDNTTDGCDQLTVISSKQYVSEPNHNLTINSLKINGNCLKISFGASGCSGDTWELKLIDSEEILETNVMMTVVDDSIMYKHEKSMVEA